MTSQYHITLACNHLVGAKRAANGGTYYVRLVCAMNSLRAALREANRTARHLRGHIFRVMNRLRPMLKAYEL